MDYQTQVRQLSLNAYGVWQRYGAFVARNPKTGGIATLLAGVVIGLLF